MRVTSVTVVMTVVVVVRVVVTWSSSSAIVIVSVFTGGDTARALVVRVSESALSFSDSAAGAQRV